MNNLFEALNLFTNSGEILAHAKTPANLQTVFRKYLLPNLPNYHFKVKELEGTKLNFALATVKIDDFINSDPKTILEQSCQKAILAGSLGKHTYRTTYRPALNHFDSWLEQKRSDDQLTDPQKQKYAPKREYGQRLDRANKGRRLYQKDPYSLKESEITEKLHKQIEDLELFCTGEYVPYRKDKPMRMVSFKNHKQRIYSFLGWLKNKKEYPLDSLDLKQIIDINLLNGFIAWGINQRKNTCGWASGFCDLALNIAKSFYACDSKKSKYRDLDIVEEIRMINNQLHSRYEEQKKATKKANRKEKMMTMEQCEAIVQYLRQCCNERDFYGCKRSFVTIARSWQRYLLVALLTYCPLRQRELRELEINRTLIFKDGEYKVTLNPEDNKTGDERVFSLSNIIHDQVAKDLDHWIQNLLPQLKAVTSDLNSWLEFINRRAYKNEAQLEQYITNLKKQIQSACDLNKTNDVIELQKCLEFALLNSEIQVNAHHRFNHNLVFFTFGTNGYQEYGRPLDAQGLGSMVKRVVYTASAALKAQGHPLFKDIDPRKTNPHYFRNIAITHERRHGDPSKREAFHKVLGNSKTIGDQVYNEMFPEEKTVDAQKWWKTDGNNENDNAFNEILKLLPKLNKEEELNLKRLLN